MYLCQRDKLNQWYYLEVIKHFQENVRRKTSELWRHTWGSCTMAMLRPIHHCWFMTFAHKKATWLCFLMLPILPTWPLQTLFISKVEIPIERMKIAGCRWNSQMELCAILVLKLTDPKWTVHLIWCTVPIPNKNKNRKRIHFCLTHNALSKKKIHTMHWVKRKFIQLQAFLMRVHCQSHE